MLELHKLSTNSRSPFQKITKTLICIPSASVGELLVTWGPRWCAGHVYIIVNSYNLLLPKASQASVVDTHKLRSLQQSCKDSRRCKGMRRVMNKGEEE
jgi:hypothetical protein